MKKSKVLVFATIMVMVTFFTFDAKSAMESLQQQQIERDERIVKDFSDCFNVKVYGVPKEMIGHYCMISNEYYDNYGNKKKPDPESKYTPDENDDIIINASSFLTSVDADEEEIIKVATHSSKLKIGKKVFSGKWFKLIIDEYNGNYPALCYYFSKVGKNLYRVYLPDGDGTGFTIGKYQLRKK